jgi:hypothetical protein
MQPKEPIDLSRDFYLTQLDKFPAFVWKMPSTKRVYPNYFGSYFEAGENPNSALWAEAEPGKGAIFYFTLEEENKI